MERRRCINVIVVFLLRFCLADAMLDHDDVEGTLPCSSIELGEEKLIDFANHLPAQGNGFKPSN